MSCALFALQSLPKDLLVIKQWFCYRIYRMKRFTLIFSLSFIFLLSILTSAYCKLPSYEFGASSHIASVATDSCSETGSSPAHSVHSCHLGHLNHCCFNGSAEFVFQRSLELYQSCSEFKFTYDNPDINKFKRPPIFS